MDSHVAVVVAHPDDESIGFGAQLLRFPGSMVVHVTDGAPRNPKEWEQKGFETREQYADARKREMNAALDVAGHGGLRISLDAPDQEAAFRLAETTQKLVDLFVKNDIKFALTHAYEGGHPDHDATAFAVHTARALMKKDGLDLGIIETPLYRIEGSRSVRQSFVPMPDLEAITLPLNAEEIALKEKLFAAHASQSKILAEMSTTTEWLRGAPDYNFEQLPNGGEISHLFEDAGIPHQKWLERTGDALRMLGLKNAAQ